MMNETTNTKTNAEVGKSAVQRFVMATLTMRWPIGCWFILNGKAVVSSPACYYWTIWPSLQIRKNVIALYWLRRGLRIEFNPPDAPQRNEP